jgi:hypothetical protein
MSNPFLDRVREKYLKDMSKYSKDPKEYISYLESITIPIEGRLKVIATRNGKVVHYDEGSNQVMIWAKHAIMRLIGGEPFGPFGDSRKYCRWNPNHISGLTDKSTLTANLWLENNTQKSLLLRDGTLVSGRQYSEYDYPADRADFYNMATDYNNYPYFPTKMLFGTMYEDAGVAANEENITQYLDIDGTGYNSLIDTRSTSILGEIRAGKGFDYVNNSDVADIYANQHPAFIYIDRPNDDIGLGKNIEVIKLLEENPEENQLSFTVNMPEQLDIQDQYPYNDFNLKVAGLYCDAHFSLNNESTTTAHAANIAAASLPTDPYKMKGGMLWAKRYIEPIVKTANTSITFKWSFSI